MDKDENKTTETSPEPKPEMTELEKVTAERDEYLQGWQRAKADFANAKKQHEAALKDYRTMANEGLIEEILPVLQSFEMAFGNKASWEKVDKNWRAGVEYIYTQLKTVVEQNGLQPVSPLGQKFDPAQHEAVRFEVTEDAAKVGTVSEVIEKGYMLGGKLIKPAKVVVLESKGE
ncbi:MAG TPA: nucleotide exchange factor GrpE [Candidatus Paceibacterota bacterium]